MAQGRGKCTRLRAQNVRKSVKSLLNLEKAVRYTARIAIQSARTKPVVNQLRDESYPLTRMSILNSKEISMVPPEFYFCPRVRKKGAI